MSEKQKKPKIGRLIRNFLLELVVYGGMVIVYTLTVLNFLGGYLTELFRQNVSFYAVLALLLIVAQGVVLDLVTSFLMDQIKLERLE